MGGALFTTRVSALETNARRVNFGTVVYILPSDGHTEHRTGRAER